MIGGDRVDPVRDLPAIGLDSASRTRLHRASPVTARSVTLFWRRPDLAAGPLQCGGIEQTFAYDADGGVSQRTPTGDGNVTRMAPNARTAVVDRVVERRRAVALARHYRETEGLSIVQIADRLGRSPATIKAYFYDPTGEKARAVKARYQGACRGCGADTQPRNGKGDAYAYCKACHPGAIERQWTRRRVLDAMLEWRARYGQLPSSYDWSRTHAHRRGGEPLKRLSTGDWPSAPAVSGVYEGWKAA